jgi:hypothetical protein
MTGTTEHAAHLEWCRNIFGSLVDGGIWGVPRSGLLFTRRGDDLVLTQRMPHMEELPMTAAELDTYQLKDYEDIRGHFEEAGIHVRREEDNDG